MTQESETLSVRPLQVVEHEHGWLEHGGGRQKARHRPVEKVALGVGIRPRWCGNCPQSLTERVDHRCDVAAVGLDVGSKHMLWRMRHVMVQRLGEGRVWRADIFLATSQQHAGALFGGAPGGLANQRRLTHTGVTRHEDHGTPFSGCGSLVGVRQQRRLGLAGDDSGERHVHQAGRERHAVLGGNFIERVPTDVEDPHGLWETLQLELTEPLEEVRATPAAHHPDGVRGQDLPGIGVSTESSCLYHWVAVVVIGLKRRLSAAESYAQPQLMVGADIVTVDGLLHRHGARQGSRGAAEHDHDPVAEALHLDSSGAGNGSTQH